LTGGCGLRVVVQRVSEASVEVGGELVARIGRGFLVLVGVESGDDKADVEFVARKLRGLRIFPSEDGEKESDRSIVDVGGEILLVPQFTLMGDVRKGNRPSFTRSESPDRARALIEELFGALKAEGVRVSLGSFREHMHVRLLNDGPYTVLIDSRKNF